MRGGRPERVRLAEGTNSLQACAHDSITWDAEIARSTTRRPEGRRTVADLDALATFDFAAFFAAKDGARRDRDMGWYELWYQSAQLNAERDVHPVCGGAVSRLGKRGETSCQYALYLLRWLGQAAEEFLEAKETGFEDHRS
jgi:hypothetical protein